MSSRGAPLFWKVLLSPCVNSSCPPALQEKVLPRADAPRHRTSAGARGRRGFKLQHPCLHALSGASEGHSLGQLPRSEQGRVEGEPAGRGCQSAETESHACSWAGELHSHPEGWAGELGLGAGPGFPCLGDPRPYPCLRTWTACPVCGHRREGTCPWPGPGKLAESFASSWLPSGDFWMLMGETLLVRPG